jgi:hypothetical protein
MYAEQHVHWIAKCIVPNLLGEREARLQTAAVVTGWSLIKDEDIGDLANAAKYGGCTTPCGPDCMCDNGRDHTYDKQDLPATAICNPDCENCPNISGGECPWQVGIAAPQVVNTHDCNLPNAKVLSGSPISDLPCVEQKALDAYKNTKQLSDILRISATLAEESPDTVLAATTCNPADLQLCLGMPFNHENFSSRCGCYYLRKAWLLRHPLVGFPTYQDEEATDASEWKVPADVKQGLHDIYNCLAPQLPPPESECWQGPARWQ